MRAGLQSRRDFQAGVLKGGDEGPALVPGGLPCRFDDDAGVHVGDAGALELLAPSRCRRRARPGLGRHSVQGVGNLRTSALSKGAGYRSIMTSPRQRLTAIEFDLARDALEAEMQPTIVERLAGEVPMS
ncbi:hypothetical protein [Methylosinus sp. KRF6]|uniref:hypothetical protein n=1 Tax=Methylosinus sp. KRF6 TaxID=2846853 RepID=UPI001C0B52A2|nr:hypothetical protein [Methylosinus sp. KRF6]MBU3888586.1 hypothetical protein [Methylosinus sp. KRF6]